MPTTGAATATAKAAKAAAPVPTVSEPPGAAAKAAATPAPTVSETPKPQGAAASFKPPTPQVSAASSDAKVETAVVHPMDKVSGTRVGDVDHFLDRTQSIVGAEIWNELAASPCKSIAGVQPFSPTACTVALGV